MLDKTAYEGLESKLNVVEVFHNSGDCLIIATGSETSKSNFSVNLLDSLSTVVNFIVYSH
jgi:hypothetical protein